MWTDLGPKQYTVETSSTLTASNWSPVAGVTWPISGHSVVLPPPTVFPAYYRVKMD